jgi:ribonuclease BN (tRNA processing enzyme)
VRITVLGKSPAWQDVGGACSGYLVEENGYTLLLDCGNGVFSKLRRVRDYVDVQAVVITHLHADHFFDLIPYGYALLHTPRQQPVPVAGWPGTDYPARPSLYVPDGAGEAFRSMLALWGNEDMLEKAFRLNEYNMPDELEIGPFRARFCEVPHYTRTAAVSLESDGRRFTFGADCSPNEQLVEFARDTDLLLIEGTLPRPERSGERGHLTPGEAGDHGKRAGARRLVVTHFSDELDRDWVHAEAAAAFGGPVAVAEEGAVYTL